MATYIGRQMRFLRKSTLLGKMQRTNVPKTIQLNENDGINFHVCREKHDLVPSRYHNKQFHFKTSGNIIATLK